MTKWHNFSNVKSSKILNFDSVAEAYGLIYPRPSGKNFSFVLTAHTLKLFCNYTLFFKKIYEMSKSNYDDFSVSNISVDQFTRDVELTCRFLFVPIAGKINFSMTYENMIFKPQTAGIFPVKFSEFSFYQRAPEKFVKI